MDGLYNFLKLLTRVQMWVEIGFTNNGRNQLLMRSMAKEQKVAKPISSMGG